MKKSMLIASLCLISSGIFAQRNTQNEMKTVFGPGTALGGFGAFSIQGTVNDKPLPKVGGYGGLVIDHKITVGGGGYGYSSDVSIDLLDSGNHFSGGYGGIFIEPVVFSKSVVHVSFPMIFGAGGNSYFHRDSIATIDQFEVETRSGTYENFFMFEPGVNLEVNLAKFLRVGVSATYLMTTLDANKSLAAADLENLSVGFNVRLGWF